MTSGLARFGRPQSLTCNLGTSGTLPNHAPGSAYSGTFNVTNRVGTVTAELVSATPALPAGWSLQVNQATGVVTLAWPAATPAGALPNLGFETGTADWVLGNGWTIDSTGLVESGTQSAKYRGVGQAAMLHAQLVPVTPGQSITATARISTGITREDFAGGEPGLLWHDANGVPISFSASINDPRPRGPAFQTVIAQGVAPPGAAFVRLFVSGFRDIKGRARDSVYVDSVTWTHTYALGGGQATNYAVVIRVRDGRGCQATLSQTIQPAALPVWDPASLSAPAVLTNGGLRLTANTGAVGTYANARATRAVAGNCYFSATVANNTAADAGFGLVREATVTTATENFVREPAMYATGGDTYSAGGLIGNGGTMASVSSVEVAVRTATRRVWIRRNGGAWVGGGDPAADTSPTLTLTGSDLLFPAATLTRAGATAARYVELHQTAAQTTGVVPAGFTAANWA